MQKKHKSDVWNNYVRTLKEGAKGAPSSDQILAQFEQGDYSSLDPQFIQDTERKNKKKKGKSYRKQKEVSV